jgi:hypothetical protein
MYLHKQFIYIFVIKCIFYIEDKEIFLYLGVIYFPVMNYGCHILYLRSLAIFVIARYKYVVYRPGKANKRVRYSTVYSKYSTRAGTPKKQHFVCVMCKVLKVVGNQN